MWRCLLAIGMVTLLVLSLVPPETPLPSTGWDKTNHVFGFVVLAFLGQRAFPRRTVPVLGSLLAYGAVIELLQFFTPDRSAELSDLVADGMGLLFGAAVAQLVSRSPERDFIKEED